jgi:hypothetical protein
LSSRQIYFIESIAINVEQLSANSTFLLEDLRTNGVKCLEYTDPKNILKEFYHKDAEKTQGTLSLHDSHFLSYFFVFSVLFFAFFVFKNQTCFLYKKVSVTETSGPYFRLIAKPTLVSFPLST